MSVLRSLRDALSRLGEARSRENEFRQRLQQWERQVQKLSADDAKAAAEAALADPTLFRCRRAPTDGDERLDPLAPGLRAFFREFDEVEAIKTSTTLARVLIAPSAVRSDFIQIGIDDEHREVGVKAGEEAVYALADDVPVEESEEERYASIYHYLAFIALVSRDQD
jgi:hypothetical protein